MLDIINEFEKYLFLQKKVALNTYNAYRKDINEFLLFLNKIEKNIYNIGLSDGKKYLDLLIKKNKSLSAVLRIIASLKIFSKFLNEKYLIPDFSDALSVSINFPILCPQEKLNDLVSLYQQKPYKFENLRISLILMILNTGKIGVTQLVNLKIYDLDYQNKQIKIFKSKNLISIFMPSDFFTLITTYLNLSPVKTDYLFYIKHESNIKPMPKAAVWSLLRCLVKQPIKNEIVSTCNEIIDPELLDNYKSNHPRC